MSGHKIPAHRNILIRSSFFAAMFTKRFSESKQVHTAVLLVLPRCINVFDR